MRVNERGGFDPSVDRRWLAQTDVCLSLAMSKSSLVAKKSPRGGDV